jgi:pyruvate formate lyase activating enzyme
MPDHESYLKGLDALARPAERQGPGAEPGTVVCTVCPHGCRLAEGKRGVCGVRFCREGKLNAPWDYTSGVAVDPLEKKPLFHVCPGSSVLSFGMLGCNLRCRFCQNWHISQAGRDEQAEALPRRTTPEQLADAASRAGSRWVAATYNEPVITAEWVVDVFRAAHSRSLRTCIVSNGFARPETVAWMIPWVDAANIDLKCFTEAGYRWLGGSLQPVLDTIRALWQGGVWVEVTTLVVPEFSDSPAEAQGIAGFLADVSPDLPWHVSAYHPDYLMSDGPAATPPATVERVCAAGRRAGLHYVYAGNLRGLSSGEDTFCPGCQANLVARRGFGVLHCHVTEAGACPRCQARIAGLWK